MVYFSNSFEGFGVLLQELLGMCGFFVGLLLLCDFFSVFGVQYKGQVFDIFVWQIGVIFILFGDSGECDLEIYVVFVCVWLGWVEWIFIWDVVSGECYVEVEWLFGGFGVVWEWLLGVQF